MAVKPSERRDDWETPLWLFDELNKEFHFDLDAAATYDNAKCDRFLSDAFGTPWNSDSAVWINPPYGATMLGRFIKKASHESIVNRLVVVMLVPARTEMTWWSDAIKLAHEVRFIRGRVAFVPPHGHTLSPAGNRPVFNSAVFVFRSSGSGCVIGETIVAPRNTKGGGLQVPLELEL